VFSLERKITLQAALDTFLLDCEAKRLTQSTQTFYKAKIGQFVKFCQDADRLSAFRLAPISHLNKITSQYVRAVQVDVQRRDLSAQYQHNLARSLRRWFNFCVADELVKKLPAVTMPKLEKHDPFVLSDEQIKTILEACKYRRDRLICLLVNLATIL
jgi:site-specific recombinase XerD